MKICTSCGKEKPLEEFYLQKGKRTREGYRNPVCKECHNKKSVEWARKNPDKVAQHRRKRNLKDKYNLSVEEYDKQAALQDYKCYICSCVPTRRRLNVDHCHKTGAIRKLLCDKCNMAIGLLEDDVDRLQKAKEYLENFITGH